MFALIIINGTVELQLTSVVTVFKGEGTQWSLLLPAQNMYLIILCSRFVGTSNKPTTVNY